MASTSRFRLPCLIALASTLAALLVAPAMHAQQAGTLGAVMGLGKSGVDSLAVRPILPLNGC